MAETAPQQSEPPKLRPAADGTIDPNSLADLVEWFLNFDERTARMRHPMVNELFEWKQSDDTENGVAVYPFENAEARFAIGIFQALNENNSEPLLKLWITDVLNALQSSHETKTEISDAYKLESEPEESFIEKAQKLTTNAERRVYLSSAWFDTLYTAEARVLGWIYQEIYGKPFTA
jgi:hypothetical protein